VPLSIKNPLLINDVNVRGTLNLLEASLKADVKGLCMHAHQNEAEIVAESFWRRKSVTKDR